MTAEQGSTRKLPLSAIRRLIYFALESWPGERAGPDSLVKRVQGVDGDRKLFWCTNGMDELVNLLPHLDRSIDVYCLRTMFGFSIADDETVGGLAAAYADEIVRIQPEGPYALGGYCLGGIVALEIARELRRRGHAVDNLTLIEVSPWHRYPTMLSYLSCSIKLADDYRIFLRSRNGKADATTLRRNKMQAILRLCSKIRMGKKYVFSPDYVQFRPKTYPGEATFVFGAESFFGAMVKASKSAGTLLWGRAEAMRWSVRSDVAERSEVRFVKGKHRLLLDPAACAGLGTQINDCLLRPHS